MEKSYSNKIYIFADQVRSTELGKQLAPLNVRFTAIQNIQEGWDSCYFSTDSIFLFDNRFLLQFASEVERWARTSPSMKFLPVVYPAAPDNENYTALQHFGEKLSYEPDDPAALAETVKNLLQPSVRIKFWGVRGSTPCANYENIRFGGNTSCVQIEKTGMDSVLILDSGTGIRNLGNYLYRHHKDNIQGHIFITHPHWDHIQGFPFFKPFYSSKNSFSIHMPEQYRGGTQDIMSGHLTKTFFPVTLNMLDANLTYCTQMEMPEDFGHYSIEYMVANHPTKTAVYKIRIGGYTIVYAPDNEIPLKSSPIRFLDKFEEFIRGCDLLIHDAQYCLNRYESRKGWGHSAWERVVEIAKRNEVKRLFLTHHDPDSNDDELSKIDEQLSRYRGESFIDIRLAKEGAGIRLPLNV